jgi:prolipoprotein diacylglyceryltransferase
MFDYPLLLRSPREALRRPVFVSWGGIIALPFTFTGFAWLSARPPLLLVDALACGLFVGHAIGRLGCLSYGCCYGRPTGSPLAITYRNPHTKAARVGGLHGVPLHPVQLYEALLDVGLVIAVNGAVILGAPVGVPTVVGMFGYSLGRFVLEFMKDNDGRMLLGPLSVNHLLCLGVVVLGFPVLGVSLSGGASAPPIDFAVALAAAPSVLPAVLLGAGVVCLGFGLHRGRVGTW